MSDSRAKAEELTADTIARAATQGDALARRIFIQAAEYMGTGIAGLINLFNHCINFHII